MLFKQITGLQKVKNRLIQTVRDQRISHAQLFLGPEGNGKLALAIAYAQYINCRNKKGLDPALEEEPDSCGTCPSCVKYNHLTHPDLHFIFPVATTKRVPSKPKSKDFMQQWRETLLSNHYLVSLDGWYNAIGIEKKQGIINADDCSDILNTLSYKSYESEYKVMILWSVERLYHSAAPKILKILEEPPDKTLFILISEHQDQIINTILSRTQIVKVPRLDRSEVEESLTQTYGCGLEEAKQIASLANGNLLTAVRLLQNKEEEQEKLERFIKWMRLCYAAKVFELNEFVNEISRIGREKQKQFLSHASDLMRTAMMINNNTTQVTVAGTQEMEFLRNFSPFVKNRNMPEIASLLNRGQYYIDRNANPQITFMNLSLQLHLLLRDKPLQK